VTKPNLSEVLNSVFNSYPPTLVEDMREACLFKSLSSGEKIIRVGQYIKLIPIVLKGLIKVSSVKTTEELLLYHIKIGESCIMSFASGLSGKSSPIEAISVEETELLLLPLEKLRKWLGIYPALNQLFYRQYELRYNELLNTLHQVVFHKIDERLFQYLKEKSELRQTKTLQITHAQIAIDLGTARAVISRLIKKLETEKKITQKGRQIEVLV